MDEPRDDAFSAAWQQVEPYTMTSRARGYALCTSVLTIVDNDIPGCMVECGVWRGGSAMLIALALQHRGAARPIVLFDTFIGMTPAGPEDIDTHGNHADTLMAGQNGPEIAELVRAEAPLETVRSAMASTGYDMRLVRFVQGDVAETLPVTHTLNIALLRLDTDFYDSTLAELVELYPRLERGGILIIDDYGHWQGAQKAVEDYFADPKVPYKRPQLWVIDYTGRGAVKPETAQRIEIPRYDYTPPGMDVPNLLSLFPHAEPGNPWAVEWPYLRPSAPHIWRQDTRPTKYPTGNASVEEAACLYTFARQFAGRRGLEIGTHFGWTAAHLRAAGLRLDCIDPAFQDSAHKAAVIEALDKVPDVVEGTLEYQLWDGFSPQCIENVRASGGGEPFSFVFIDGNHDGDAPRQDAEGVLEHLADDAMVVFHDLISPYVAAGLKVFRDAGFETRLINTMQVLGVAWRGHVQPPTHQPDKNVPPIFEKHLNDYAIEGSRPPAIISSPHG